MTKGSKGAFIGDVKRSKRIGLVIGALLLGFVALIVLPPPGPHFQCHRLIDGALSGWQLETTNGVWFPNVGGSSSNSLVLLVPYMGCSMHDLRDYRYVPGLKSDDPGNLLLFYMSKPSRRTYHGDVWWQCFRNPKQWVVLNLSMSNGGGNELAESLSTTEFKARLKITIEFLKKNERPGWQKAEEEHTAFLNSLKE